MMFSWGSSPQPGATPAATLYLAPSPTLAGVRHQERLGPDSALSPRVRGPWLCLSAEDWHPSHSSSDPEVPEERRASAEGVANPQRKPPRLVVLSPLAWNLEQREETGLTFPPDGLLSA